MAYATHCNSIIREEFFKPLFEFFHSAKHRRNCPSIDDSTWLEAGVRRCLGIYQSGRDFLQQLADRHDTEILISTFFESLKSKRRLRLLDEVLAQSRVRMRRAMPDPFAAFPCLEVKAPIRHLFPQSAERQHETRNHRPIRVRRNPWDQP